MMLLLVIIAQLSCGSRAHVAPAARLGSFQIEPPSVLVILIDDAGWTEVQIMPALDGLAAMGVTFTRAYSQPICVLTRIALMYGELPRRHGIGWDDLDPQVPTDERLPLELLSLAEIMKPTRATALAGKWHLGRAPLVNGATAGMTTTELTAAQRALGPYCQGFDAWPGGNTAALGPGGYYSWRRVIDGNVVVETAYATDAQADALIAWWQATAGPKFGVFAPNAAHASSLGHEPPPGYAARPTNRENYEQVVEYLGQKIGDVLAAVGPNTYVVFTTDNGVANDALPPGWPANVAKGTTFDGGVRMPLIITGPGVAQGIETDRLVGLIDLGPTLAELVGVPIARGFQDAVSFADELGAWFGTPEREWLFVECYRSDYDDQAVVEADTLWPGTLVTVRLKLRRVDPDGTGPLPTTDTLYDLLTDPYETDGVSLYAPSVPAAVRNRLLAELASLPPRAP